MYSKVKCIVQLHYFGREKDLEHNSHLELFFKSRIKPEIIHRILSLIYGPSAAHAHAISCAGEQGVGEREDFFSTTQTSEL